MTFEKNIAFALSCQVRPIKAFDPEILLENNFDEQRRFLSADSKLLWFYQFCLEQGIKGKVDTQFVSSGTLKDIPCSEFEGGMASLVKEYWTATVSMNDEIVGTATASGTFAVNDRNERDLVSSQLRKFAIGAALSQAGFGIVSRFDMTTNDIAQLAAETNQPGIPAAPVNIPQQTNPGVQPVPMAPPVPQQMVQDDFFGTTATPHAAPAINFGNPAPVNIPAHVAPPPVKPAQPQLDPLTAAKQMVWPAGGRFKGKTLVSILSESGVNGILYIVNDYTPRNEEGQQIKAAAKIILDSLQTGR